MSPDRTSRLRAHGFSLVEAVIAMGVMAVLLLGMGGALSMSVSSLDRGNDINSRALSAMEAADRMAADLGDAIAVEERTDTAITILVADRDQNGTSERIRFSFDDAAGRITRQVNAGDPTVLLTGIGDAEFRTLVWTLAAGTESAERLLASCDGLLTLSSFKVDGNSGCGQVVMPPFDSTVASWSVTRVRLWMTPDGAATASLRVRLMRTPRFGTGTQLLSEAVIRESDLPLLGGWVTLPLPKASGLSTSDAVLIAVVEEGATSGAAGRVSYFGSGSLPYNTYMTTTSDAGVSWSGPSDSADLRFELYGTVTSQGGL